MTVTVSEVTVNVSTQAQNLTSRQIAVLATSIELLTEAAATNQEVNLYTCKTLYNTHSI